MKRIATALIIVLVLAGFCFGALLNTFNIATPAGTDDPREADDRMREIKAAVQERMNDRDGITNEGDHYWPLSGNLVSDPNTGQHRMVSLRQLSGNPSTAITGFGGDIPADTGILYTKALSTETELYYQDESENVVQLTYFGYLGGISNFFILNTTPTMLFDESDQVDPAGDYKMIVSGDSLTFQGRNTADTAYNSIITLTREGNIALGNTSAGAAQRKITNLAQPSGDQDAATRKYVDDEIAASDGRCKAWVSFDGTDSNPITVNGGYNIDGTVSKSDTGVYGITWDTNFADTNYAVNVSAGTGSYFAAVFEITEGTCTIKTYNGAGFAADPTAIYVTAFGQQ